MAIRTWMLISWLAAILINLSSTVRAGILDADDTEFARRETRIRKEVKELGRHDWAGHYDLGDGLGVNISFDIAPNAGATFIWRACVGIMQQQYGKVTEKDGRIKIRWEDPNGIGEKPAQEYLIVNWGERRYLVPPEELPCFCDCIAKKNEPRDEMQGLYFLRDGDDKKPCTGMPHLPKEFERYLKLGHIRGKIKSVGPGTIVKHADDGPEYGETRCTAVLNIGAAEGVLPRMRFFNTEHVANCRSVDIRVTHVREHDCDAIVAVYHEPNEGVKTPQIGCSLSTNSMELPAMAEWKVVLHKMPADRSEKGNPKPER